MIKGVEPEGESGKTVSENDSLKCSKRPHALRPNFRGSESRAPKGPHDIHGQGSVTCAGEAAAVSKAAPRALVAHSSDS